ncbi:MAG: sodium/solute symporter [Gammaproteobacteria bacterium]|jgi:SSS family solute:Na+ symporter|nr:sodium/solute symporter [Luminiphilus sp.]NCG07793.1 sodium/solute symporter [Gammaproteobacteria bacterium]
MPVETLQLSVFVLITATIGWLTYRKVSSDLAAQGGLGTAREEVFLAGKGLSWVVVAGSITLTNLSTDQLVGMNGNQMVLLAWWELAAVVGLVILGKVILPVYYRYNCTTTTELLEKRYGDRRIRALIGLLFLLGNLFIFIPAMLYGGSLFIQTMFNVDIPLLWIAIAFALVGSAYAVLGGLRAVAVSDAYSGVLLLTLGVVVVLLSLSAIDFDFSGIPAERLTLIGDNNSPIPWHTLLTGMVFIQIFYWGTNQTITQRAMASPTVEEGQKGVLAAAAIRLVIIPPLVVVPGLVSYKLYGDIGDAAFGTIVGDVLPLWLSGAFAAAIAAAVLTSVNSVLNSSTTLWVCDIHEPFINASADLKRLNLVITLVFVVIGLAMVPVYATADSIINLVQELYGLLSMPILSAFIVGLLFRGVAAGAAIIAVVLGVFLYGFFSFVWAPLHYIHMMFFTVILCVLAALIVSRLVFGTRPIFDPVIRVS